MNLLSSFSEASGSSLSSARWGKRASAPSAGEVRLAAAKGFPLNLQAFLEVSCGNARLPENLGEPLIVALGLGRIGTFRRLPRDQFVQCGVGEESTSDKNRPEGARPAYRGLAGLLGEGFSQLVGGDQVSVERQHAQAQVEGPLAC